MNAALRRSITAGSLGGLLLAVAFAVWAATHAATAHRRLDALRSEHDRWSAARQPAVESQRQARTEGRVAPAAEPTSPPPTEKDGETARRDRAADVAALRIRASEAEVAGRFGLLFARLSLRPETISFLTAEMARHDRTLEDLGNQLPAAARGDPAHPALAAMQVGIAEEHRRHRGALESRLDAQALRELDRFEQATPHWAQVSELAVRLYDTRAPLTPAQASALGDLMIAAATQRDGTIARVVANQDAMLAQAAAILSPAQLETLRALQVQADLWAQANRRRSRPRRPAFRNRREPR